MNFDQWCDQFRPIQSANDPDTEFDGLLHDVNDPALEGVDHAFVWTLVDSGMCRYVLPSRQFANREGYFMTEEPWWDDNMAIAVDDRECFRRAA